MQAIARLEQQLRRQLNADADRIEAAVVAATDSSTQETKRLVRERVAVGLRSVRAANAIRDRRYVNPGSVAGVVLSNWRYKKPGGGDTDIIGEFAAGAVIRKPGGSLAVPLEAAGRMAGRQRGGRPRITPEQFMARTGLRLRLVLRPGLNPLLVTQGGSLTKRGIVRNAGKRQAPFGPIRQPRLEVPVFVLVREIRLRQRINMAGVDTAALADLETRFRTAIATFTE